ncbi:dolichyl-diphosphooligosaccharide--protein glycosyltransferase subunit 1 [Coemansia sp. RSA 454]|nr:dolichyl-diphosphooligosaccharide--protein glycosyltransferase subunit 1 [Coemansia sp. RSA 454]
MKPNWQAFATLLLSALAFSGTTDAVEGGLVHTNAIRTIDLRSLPAVTEQIGVVVQNVRDSKAIKTFTVYIPHTKADRLAKVTVHERKSGAELQVSKMENEPLKYSWLPQPVEYRATLLQPLQPSEKISLNIDCVYLNTIEPRPKVVEQTGDQIWLWKDDARLLWAYPIHKEKTVVRTNGEIKSYSQIKESSKDGKSVTFGPFIGGESPNAPVEVRFRDNREQLEAMTHRREYFVSHWSNDLNILEHYALRNRAPALDAFDKVKQTMSRFMKARDNFVKTLLVKVPADAREMYVVDEIGNVSTSSVTSRQRLNGDAFKVMQLKPRYPLAGQWNYTWWHGYSVPLSNYLRVNRNHHALRVPFIGSIVGSASQNEEIPLTAINTYNTAVSKYELRITLPEGATNVDVRVPFDVDSIRQMPQSYYFDSSGRTVVVVEHANVAPSAVDAHVLVTYDYSMLSLWQKPLVIAFVVFALFALTSLGSRMQLGLAAKPALTAKKTQ